MALCTGRMAEAAVMGGQAAAPQRGATQPVARPVGHHGIQVALSQALAEWIAAAKAYAQCLRPPAPRSAFRGTYEARQAHCAQFKSALALAQALEAMVAVMVRIRGGQEGAVSDEMFLAATLRLQSARKVYFTLCDRQREIAAAEAARCTAAVTVVMEEGRVRTVVSEGPVVATLVDDAGADPSRAVALPVEVDPQRARAWRVQAVSGVKCPA